MSRNKIGLGIEVAGDELRLALLEQTPEGPAVRSTQTVPRDGDLAKTLRALPARPAGVVCAVSLEGGAVRILDLPPTTDENLERVVVLEAEGVLPLPAEELAMAHQVLGMTEQSRVEVLLAAGLLPNVQGALSQVNCLPWVSASVTVTSIALFNAVQQLRGSSREAVCAVLRIEESGSELMVLERNRILSARPIPYGCGAAGASAGRSGAEAARYEQGGVAVLSQAPASSGWIAPLAQQVRFALQALSYERGLQIQRLYVCGAGAARPEVDWELSGQLEMPVSLLGPEGGAVSGPPEGARFATAYGCALQAVGAAGVALNLTPARVTTAREEVQRRQSAISWGALGGSVVLAAALVFGALVLQKQNRVERLEAQLRGLNVTAVERPPVPVEDLTAVTKAVQTATSSPVPPAKLLEMLNESLPQSTWLGELTYNAENNYVIRGFSTDSLGGQLAQSELLKRRVFEEVPLDYVNEEAMGDVPVWEFQITCKLPRESEGAAADGPSGRSR